MSPDSGVAAASGHADSVWDALLSHLEADLLAAYTDDFALTPWAPPLSMPAMPAHFVERAKLLVAAQDGIVEAMRREQADINKHLAALRAVPHDNTSARPLYLDVAS